MTTAQMQSPCWLELLPELLGQILSRICCPRRRSTKPGMPPPPPPPPPPFPWLTLPDGTFLSIHDGKVIRMPEDGLPVPYNASCRGSFADRLLLMQSNGECSLVNPFSSDKAATVDLPNVARICRHEWLAGCHTQQLSYKLVTAAVAPSSSSSSSSLDSSARDRRRRPLAAVLAVDSNSGVSAICLCHPPVATDFYGGRALEPFHLLRDVAFFNGNLYGVTCDGKLVLFEICDSLDLDDSLLRTAKIAAIRCVINPAAGGFQFQPPPKTTAANSRTTTTTYTTTKEYLVECGGRLLMVKRTIESAMAIPWHGRTAAFEVFEADLSTEPAGTWRRVETLGGGGQVLFVGKHCSMSFPAGERSGVQEDCIYFMCDYTRPEVDADPLCDSGVYDMRNGVITPLLPDTAEVPQYGGGHWRPTWIFPTDETTTS